MGITKIKSSKIIPDIGNSVIDAALLHLNYYLVKESYTQSNLTMVNRFTRR